VGGWKVVRGAAPPEAIKIVTACALSVKSDDVKVLRRGNTRSTFLVPSLGVIKIFRRAGTRATFISLFTPSALAREYDLTEAAIRRGIPAPRPFFCATRSTLGLLREAAIVFEIVPDSSLLQHLIEGHFPRPGLQRRPCHNIRRILAQFGATLARLHRSGGIHGDPSPDNVLVKDTSPDAPVLIDWSFALFAGESAGAGPIGRRIHIRQAAKRYKTRLQNVRAALQDDRERAAASAAFEKLRTDDTKKMVAALLLCGTPAREILACLDGYCRELGLSHAEQKQLIETLTGLLTPLFRNSIRRTMRNADRSSRKIDTIRGDKSRICFRRELTGTEIRKAFAEDAPSLTIGNTTVERRVCRDALGVWRNACVLTRFKLPVRYHVACEIVDGTNEGRLLLDHLAGHFETPDPISPGRLAQFVRLLHTFGFRFVSCSEGTILAQPVSFGPFTARQGNGYVLDDAGAVAFMPEAPVEESADVVASWLRDTQGAGVADEFLAASRRPLRLRL